MASKKKINKVCMTMITLALVTVSPISVLASNSIVVKTGIYFSEKMDNAHSVEEIEQEAHQMEEMYEKCKKRE